MVPEKRLAGVTSFPQDLREEHGYDNRGGNHLPLPPFLLFETILAKNRSVFPDNWCL